MRVLKLFRYKLRTLLGLTTLVALLFAWVLVPLESKRRAMIVTRQRGISVWLADDPTSSFSADLNGEEFVPPGLFTNWMHKILPEAYVRGVERVTLQSENLVTEANIKAISKLGPVASLWIDTRLDDGNWLRHLVESRNVSSVGLAGHKVSPTELDQIGQMTKLRALFVDEVPMSGDGMRRIEKLQLLKYLRLQDTGCDDQVIRCVANHLSLENLEIRESQITAAGTSSLSTLTKLRSLKIFKSRIGDDGFQCLSAMNLLTDLDLSGNPITDQILSRITSATQMRSLNLSSTDIDGSGLKYLSPQRKLFSLVLAHTQVCRGLENVADLPELYLISLDFTPLTDEALEPLSRSISLNEIYFRGTEVTDEGLMQLAKIPSLRRMLVANSKVTPEGIQRLKAIRPDVATD